MPKSSERHAVIPESHLDILDSCCYPVVSTVRPDGMACRARAYKASNYDTAPANEANSLPLYFTEFADPGGRATYLLTPNPSLDVFEDDELLGP